MLCAQTHYHGGMNYAEEDVARILGCSLYDPSSREIEASQIVHRLELVKGWPISPGNRVLEIGCGQGNCTAVLADTVGPTGHVDAIDPAPGDYGAPYTLDQAQAHLSASELGSRITWRRAGPREFLAEEPHLRWDVAVLAHSIWYFESIDMLAGILAALKGRVGSVCIAEYAMQATETEAAPHVLAAAARGILEAYKANSTENIRLPVDPSAITEAAEKEGWVIKRQRTLVPGPELGDGGWETSAVAHVRFLEEIESCLAPEEVKVVLRSLRHSVVGPAGQVKVNGRVRTMDVWVADMRSP